MRQEPTISETSSDQQAKLLELFENRNLIKRELDQVIAERNVLKADVEDLRNRHDELRRQLTNLEQMLADAERGQSAIIYYRLRAVWDTCRQQLRLLAEDFNNRYEKAERAGFEQNLGKDHNHHLDDLTQQFDKLERERRNLRNSLGDLQKQLASLQKFWQKSRREDVQFRIDRLTKQFKPIEAEKLELLGTMELLRSQKPQVWPGISIASRRTVNLWLLALAQYLYMHFSEYNISDMARSAGTKPVSDVNFGLLNDCLAIGNHIYEVVIKLRGDKTRPDKLRFRAEHLRSTVTYASDSDTIPEESCLDYMPLASQAAPTIDAEAQPVAANVLRLNYWDVQNILLKPPESVQTVEPRTAAFAD
ncbi:MAG: hypothetical protein ACRESE_03130 [Gammaproteobacteria bacterium]